MIKYNLICKCGKTFESWFSSSGEFDILRKKKLINCIYCDSALVKKTVMAPNLSSKTNKISKNIRLEKRIKKQLLNFKKYIEKIAKMLAITLLVKQEGFITTIKLQRESMVEPPQKKPRSYWKKV